MSDLFNPVQPITDLQLTDTENVIAGKATFIAMLKNLGIVSIQAEYNGSGDEGQVDTLTAVTADNTEIDLSQHKVRLPGIDHPRRLSEVIEDFAWNATQHFHCGFHNGDGGFGTLTIHVDSGRVKLEHNDNIVETEYSENEF